MRPPDDADGLSRGAAAAAPWLGVDDGRDDSSGAGGTATGGVIADGVLAGGAAGGGVADGEAGDAAGSLGAVAPRSADGATGGGGATTTVGRSAGFGAGGVGLTGAGFAGATAARGGGAGFVAATGCGRSSVLTGVSITADAASCPIRRAPTSETSVSSRCSASSESFIRCSTP